MTFTITETLERAKNEKNNTESKGFIPVDFSSVCRIFLSNIEKKHGIKK
jgi:hypothetical protein